MTVSLKKPHHWLHRLSARTAPFQGAEAGSIPAGTVFFIMDAIQQTSKSKIIISQISSFVKKLIIIKNFP